MVSSLFKCDICQRDYDRLDAEDPKGIMFRLPLLELCQMCIKRVEEYRQWKELKCIGLMPG